MLLVYMHLLDLVILEPATDPATQINAGTELITLRYAWADLF